MQEIHGYIDIKYTFKNEKENDDEHPWTNQHTVRVRIGLCNA